LQLKYFPLLFITSLVGGLAHAQATFGDVVRLGTTPSDIVLDESRSRLYLVNSSANSVQVWDYVQQTLLGSITVGARPLAAAMSMDNSTLYVTNHDSSTLSVISLAPSGLGAVINTVALPAEPEGVAVGLDGRAVICTDGSGTTSTLNTLLIFDGTQAISQQVLAVQFPPAAVTPPSLTAPAFPKPTTQFNGKLQTTPDGKYIIGVSSITTNTATVVYQYEVDSGTILQSRTVTGQSSIMAMAPDGASFMAGFTLYGTANLNVIAQQNIANAPFPMTGAFSTVTNLGGSVFTSDGQTLYSAFNNSTTTTTTASTLLVSDPHTLAITLGINLPESVLSKIVITADGSQAWALSSSGMIHLPLGNLYTYPILMPQSTTVFLAQDNCNPGVAQGTLNINNVGGGTLTFAVPQGLQTAIVATASSGLAPSTITFTMDPGRSSVVRTPGTNLYTGAGATAATGTNTGTALAVNLTSPNAINIPNTIQVYMNFRDSTQRGQIYPVPTSPFVPTTANPVSQGLQDIVLDATRNLIYITNAGYNRIEVFDTVNRVFLTPITVGQLPHQMAMGTDGNTLYVANTGGESISIVDLTQQLVTGSITFPPIPRLGNANVNSVQTMAMGLSGLQFVMLQPTTPTQTTISGTLWEVIGNNAVPRTGTTVTGVTAAGAQSLLATANQSSMIASADGTSILLLGGTGITYLYNALTDSYTSSANVFGGSTIFGYYGPVGAASDANFLLADGLVMNNSLTAIGGATEPGMTTVAPPTMGGGGGVSVSSTGLRNVASVAPVDENDFARLTTPVRTNLTTTITADTHTTLEVVNVVTGAITSTFRIPENPPFSVFNTTRQPTPPRQMVVDAQGTAYAITLSGLSVIPLAPASATTTPMLSPTQPIVNSVDGTTTFAPGSFVTINGSSLASAAIANALPPPTVLGGSCVVMNDVAIPLLQTASGQIAGQIPSTMRAGEVVMQVRSLATAQSSSPVVVTIHTP
jgi:DNA-binding beta-propeller fold protein YncE